MRKLNNKGFTLVEIVIVIVIIAILAAMLVPALTQWIDKSKKKTFLSSADTIRTSVSALCAEKEAIVSGSGTIAASDASQLTADVGQSIAVGDAVSGGAKFCVNAGATADSMTVKDAKYQVTWANGAWSDVTEISGS